jgi:hypothetical protein
MGISPNLWGSQAWHFIHMVALSYPENPTEQDKEKYLHFFSSLGNVLPCPICGQSFLEKMKKYPPNFEKLFEWTVDIHNTVNAENGKAILSYEEAKIQVLKNTKSDNYLFKGISLSLAIIFIILLSSFIVSSKNKK